MTPPCPLAILWMIGATMCDGRSLSSWTMNSPRSVSSDFDAGVRERLVQVVSSVTIDFDLTARRTPCWRAISIDDATAVAAVSAQCTWRHWR